ncbi:MAG: BREX-1 system phosphatase PglZ type B [Chlorobium sp.]|uniref:BREX-1 system phosphatase PglZ type B n=1 Tax=Chlorobium sp. TaxID=1095 RepID=UPI0025BCB710|nr:BREX-1 system phosphatase PglZ type B [Chlorobium sp.]MCF8215293.1 BREX-1 system phosphatase PglZ type B [Chlorobium sp.]MCF8270130.1 BREX-1 system phosphatase PglZ type B [Chlorobium sp.]MCF8286500.1 BREX-1 system phosphatase PglZ type B [Chlorobium sp.]MCF8290098.1 BREX-1 system phosphatase PglZ type B [Chlorobium sp.]MCF8384170.1 BREX-1 system phosphatase PglZ type B [Chlorobium sp.]
MSSILQNLLTALRDAAVFNPEVQVAPACILWPDRDRQWEAVIPVLQAELPELMILGDYVPEKRSGPAIWLRCVIAGRAEDVSLPKDRAPIVYLPGVSRQDLRAVESCQDHLKPLAELQYRGVIWSQINAKDWTILAWLKSDQGGLGLDVAQDNEAKSAMQLALYRLLDEEVSLLKGKRLDKDYFNTLLTGGDPIRDLLQWLDQGEAFQAGRPEHEWKAFVEVCRSQLAFNPQSEGVLAGSTKLANHEGPWHAVWERYCEAPKRYPHIPGQIRKCQPPVFDLFADDKVAGGWPQWNDDQEINLHRDLLALAKVPAHEARAKIKELEKQHSRRRSLVWTELGEAPLACALEHLSIIAETTKTSLAAGSVDDLAGGYQSWGWRVDDGVLRSLAHVDAPSDVEAVTTAVRAVYLPWMEDSARYIQKLLDGASYPGGTCLTAKPASFSPGDCVLFVDGLRFDLGKRLVDSIEARGFEIFEEPAWTALPSVTATGKAAVTPVRDKIRGEDGSPDFEPSVADTGQSLKGGYHLKKLLANAGWSILERSADGDGQGMAWCEFGDIDHEGHDRGWKLAKRIDALMVEITDRIMELLVAGWKRVRVVTDHGWLLLPGGLPKIDLPSALADNKWGRCASLKPGATSEDRLYPWYWNPHQYFALADGVSCFKKGEEYTHGGLSLQECLTLQLTVTRGESAQAAAFVEFTDVVWKGLRCTVAVVGNFSGLSLDVRSQAGNSLSSVVVGSKPLKDNGTASVVVENEEMEGREATVVLIDTNGSLVAQIGTVIGGDVI